MAGAGQPLKWDGRLEDAFEAEVERLGGLQAARPKQVLEALQPRFPALQLRVESVKWHLQAHRRRAQREAELADRQDGPVRWTGPLKKAFERVVEEAGGLSQTRPKAVWEALVGEWPQLTVPSCKWHIQTLRKKEAARGGGGGGGGSGSRGGNEAEEEEEEEGEEEGSWEEDEDEGSDRAATRQPAARAKSEPSHGPAAKPSSLQPPRSTGRQQQTGKRASMDQPPVSQEGKQRPGGSGSSAAASPLSASHGSMFAEAAAEAQWRAAAAQQRQQRRQPSQPLAVAWEAYTLPAAEARLHHVRTQVARVRQLHDLLLDRAKQQAEVLEALQGTGSGSPTRQLAAMRQLTPAQAAQLIVGQSSGDTPDGGAAALDSFAPLMPLLQAAAAQAAAQAASLPRHSAADCTVLGCRRCAYDAKLAKAEALALAAQQQAQEAQLHALALQMETAASLDGSVQMLDAAMLGSLLDHLPLPSPLEPPPLPAQQAQQQAAMSCWPAGAPAAISSRPLGRAGSDPAVQQPPPAEARELHAAHPEIDLAVCVAICGAVADGMGRLAMAAFLSGAGARSPEDVTRLLSTTAFVGVAHEATRATGVTLAQWATLLAACRPPP